MRINGMVQMRRAEKCSGANSTTIRVTVRSSAMRASVPGTTHSTTLHRDECAILRAAERAPSVKKLKSGRIENTRSSLIKFQLRPHPLAGKIESIVSAWLHIGGGKRLVTLYTTAGVTLEALRDELATALAGFGIAVVVHDDHVHTEEMPMSPNESNGQSTLSQEQQWQYCVFIHDLVEQIREHERQEAHLLAEAERVRTLKLRAQEDALEAITQAFAPKGSAG
jgi:hypothetical protein